MKYKIIALLAILLLFSFACKKKEPASPIMAQVNDEVLTEAAFRSLFSDAEWDTLSAGIKRKYVEDWVSLTLLAQAADEQELSKSTTLRARLDFAQKKVKANAMIAQRLANIKVSEDELFNYFRVHRGDFGSNLQEYSIQRIQVRDKAAADLLQGKLAAGMSFEEAVRSYSIEPLQASGGMMGFVTKAGADSSFWNAAVGLKPNESAILNRDSNWYVFRVVEERSGNQEANFEDFKDEIRRRIISEKEEAVYQDLVRELKRQNDKIYYY